MKKGAGARPPPPFLPGAGRLGGGNDRGELGRDVAEHVVDLGADAFDRQYAHDGDQADEHAVFDEGRALIVLRKTSNQVTHERRSLFKG